MTSAPPPPVVRFGMFQIDMRSGELLRSGRVVRLKPQPFKLLQLLISRAGEVVTREEIRQALWGADTFVDFEQGVNSAIKQVREALSEDADHPLYVETIPKRGYRFIAPIDGEKAFVPPRGTDLRLHKALWLNIAELRLSEYQRRERRRRLRVAAVIGALLILGAAALGILLFRV